jgi:hypothetical protein
MILPSDFSRLAFLKQRFFVRSRDVRRSSLPDCCIEVIRSDTARLVPTVLRYIAAERRQKYDILSSITLHGARMKWNETSSRRQPPAALVGVSRRRRCSRGQRWSDAVEPTAVAARKEFDDFGDVVQRVRRGPI